MIDMDIMDDQKAIGCAALQDAKSCIIDACVQWARIKGYCESAGLLMGLTVVSREPVSLGKLVEETGYSKSTVSSNMNLLESQKMVKRIVIPGDKRHIYAPIVDPVAVKANMLDSIEKDVQYLLISLRRAERGLQYCEGQGDFLQERIASLRQTYEQGMNMIEFMKKQSLTNR